MINKNNRNFLSRNLIRISLLAWGLSVLYPILWTAYTSLKDNKQLFADAWALPKVLHFENYVNAWINSNIASNFLNSFFVTIIATFLSLVLSATTSYVLARYKFKGDKVLYTILISAMMIPHVLAIIPLFFLLEKMNMLNSLFGLSLVYTSMVIPLGIFILTSFFKTLPKELEEAAEVDGCGHFAIFFKIMLPLSKSGLITVGLMNLIVFWNEYFMGLVFLQEPTKYTLPVGIAYLAEESAYRADWGALFAGLVIAMVPIIVIYSLFQKRITEGLTSGALK
ncbi:carbohydrate ABC transporter permease [Bacillus salipaludis]|uniref:Carbohydrate ABC transporter permease n=1 Tax=Bacillus salipaludis TaxID=2547811 RepID=A0ABW8RNP7_9BACI